MNNPLGQKTEYDIAYSPEILFPIERDKNLVRNDYSFDFWNAYEFSWLNQHGLPQVALLSIRVSALSLYIVESKSLKLYLNTYAFLAFQNHNDVCEQIEKDLQKLLQGEVRVELLSLEEINPHAFPAEFVGFNCLEKNSDSAFKMSLFDKVDSGLLKTTQVSLNKPRKLYSNLFRSLCPVTSQPDWASVFIVYQGHEIDEESLLSYLLSYRKHQGFHEACVESIFQDVLKVCQPESLAVYAAFTRRGGIDINPLRANNSALAAEIVKVGRQVRQ